MKKTIIIAYNKSVEQHEVEVLYEFSMYGEAFIVHKRPFWKVYDSEVTCTHLHTGARVVSTEEVETKNFYMLYVKSITTEKELKKAIKEVLKKTSKYKQRPLTLLMDS